MRQPSPVYEWYKFEDVTLSLDVGPTYNPPFLPGAAGRLQPYMTNGPILRGFIKRSLIAGTVPAHDVGALGRLYFMFNPTSLSQAWNYDPSTYLWNNTSAADQSTQPAGQAAFNFALFFERSIEVARDADHPGVLVDVDLLSFITRGVPANLAATAVPSGPGTHFNDVNSANPAVQADPNGVFIGQGQLIDCVFSKYMTVRGNVTSLQIDYVKFSHRMIPTMCSINLGLLVQAQSVGTQQPPDTATPPPAATNGGGAATGDPANRYGGSAGGTG